jgi:hypothetical protein
MARSKNSGKRRELRKRKKALERKRKQSSKDAARSAATDRSAEYDQSTPTAPDWACAASYLPPRGWWPRDERSRARRCPLRLSDLLTMSHPRITTDSARAAAVLRAGMARPLRDRESWGLASRLEWIESRVAHTPSEPAQRESP